MTDAACIPNVNYSQEIGVSYETGILILLSYIVLHTVILSVYCNYVLHLALPKQS